MCKRNGVARTTHKTGFGVGFFFLVKKKRALNSEELKSLCCHSFQALLDLLIHMRSIFSLKVSFSLSEGSNSELLRITINWAGTVSQTFAKTSQLTESYPRFSHFLIHHLLCSTEMGKNMTALFSLSIYCPQKTNPCTGPVFPNNPIWSRTVLVAWKDFLSLEAEVLKARNRCESLTRAHLSCWSPIWQST